MGGTWTYVPPPFPTPLSATDIHARHIVQFSRAKQKKWLAAKRSGDFTDCKSACITVKAANRSHHRNQESRLVYSNNRHNFHSYIGSKLNTRDNHISLSLNDCVVDDSTAGDIFNREFSKNFSTITDVVSCIDKYITTRWGTLSNADLKSKEIICHIAFAVTASRESTLVIVD